MTTICPVCGFAIQHSRPVATTCPRCRNLVVPANAGGKRKSGSSGAGWIVLGLVGVGLVMVGLLLWGDVHLPQAPPPPFEARPGDRVALGYRGGKGSQVFLGRTFSDFDALVEAQNAESKDLLSILIAQNRVLMVPAGTQAVVEKRPAGSGFVHIVSGEHAGQSGWIQFEMLRPLSEYP